MNVNTNSYTVGFACAMVLIVAALLAYMSIQLTPLQDRNIELEKKQNILQSVGSTLTENLQKLHTVNILKKN